MGFFTDLKDDLSQAVNELMPEELEQTAGEEKKTEETDGKTDGKADEKLNGMEDLEALLDRVDTIELPGEPEEEKDYYIPEPKVTERKTEPPVQIQQPKSKSDETAVITAGMVISGDISSEGSLELIGTINGNIDILGKLNITGTIQGNSKAAEIYAENAKITGEVNSVGSVKIGQSSVVIGNIFAVSAVIAGAVKGDIDVHGPVILDTSAIVMGNIKSKSVQINNGAVIEGMCSQCYADVNPTSFFEEFKKGKK